MRCARERERARPCLRIRDQIRPTQLTISSCKLASTSDSTQQQRLADFYQARFAHKGEICLSPTPRLLLGSFLAFLSSFGPLCILHTADEQRKQAAQKLQSRHLLRFSGLCHRSPLSSMNSLAYVWRREELFIIDLAPCLCFCIKADFYANCQPSQCWRFSIWAFFLLHAFGSKLGWLAGLELVLVGSFKSSNCVHAHKIETWRGDIYYIRSFAEGDSRFFSFLFSLLWLNRPHGVWRRAIEIAYFLSLLSLFWVNAN